MVDNLTRWSGRILAFIAGLGATGVLAQGEPTGLPVIGVPVPGGVNYQPAVTSVAHDMHWLSNWVHGIMAVIVIFVTLLLLAVVVRYNRRANPEPSTFTHNTRLEIAWTIVPVVILVLIGSFSLPVLFKQLEIPEPDVTIKATGNQWYWTYEYPDYEMYFDSLLLEKDALEEHGYSPDLHLLATDTSMVVPVGAVVNMQITGADVIHAWTVPAFGVKIDAVPGRLNETWFAAEEEGIYFGQCSELCGKDHSYMPITVKVVSQEAYDAWLDWAIDEYGGVRPGEEEAAEEAPAGAAVAAESPEDGDGAASDGEADADVEAAEEAEAAGETVGTDDAAEEAAAEADAAEEGAAEDADLDAEAGDAESDANAEALDAEDGGAEDAAEPAN